MRLSRVLKSCKEFFYRKEGASGIEYAIAAAMVAVVLTAFITPISGSVSSVMTKVQGAMTKAQGTTPSE
ncbi:Flp family type IVb pilin [Pseudomonas sp. SBB6]|uniref:Flp family type IVb pilin n=1 Tax=Pseudomonas sp. SBB6 TaxID=2962032 RepID=UPI0020B8BB55|nr:Flp family type IVb pilin [Pseudomonas sp. SBB6]MCP3750380.1 Flp family type IVb pilin [Pseudomonas sp. SBB6]